MAQEKGYAKILSLKNNKRKQLSNGNGPAGQNTTQAWKNERKTKKLEKKKAKKRNLWGETRVYCSLLSSIHGSICIAKLPAALSVVKCLELHYEYLFRALSRLLHASVRDYFYLFLEFYVLSCVGKEENRSNKWRNF